MADKHVGTGSGYTLCGLRATDGRWFPNRKEPVTCLDCRHIWDRLLDSYKRAPRTRELVRK